MSQLSLELEPTLDYELRISPRAKRLSLRVEPGRGLIVTVPKRFPRRDIPEFVESNRIWIEEALADIDQKTPEPYRQWPPRQLSLQAIGRCANVCYLAELDRAGENSQSIHRDQQRLSLSAHSGSGELEICVTSKPQDKLAVASELASCLVCLAQQTLPGWLAAHADRTGMCYERVSIRKQRTLWGSYSSSGTLSLNYKLLFLHRELVDYVLLHELAHTRFLDHSPRFWNLLESIHPNAMSLDSQLKEAGRDVPPWLELAR
ncbi:MAG: M48 family metallopeptidase [Granulosicoccus sp.]